MMVYVLNQVTDEGTAITNCVFKKYNDLVQYVIEEERRHIGDFSEEDESNIKSDLDEQMFYSNGLTDYTVQKCKVC